jgi:hypothetical protein
VNVGPCWVATKGEINVSHSGASWGRNRHGIAAGGSTILGFLAEIIDWLILRQGFDDQCLGFIASRLRHAAFASGETIFEYGERGDEMFLVVEGAVVLHAGKSPSAAADQPDRGAQLAPSGVKHDLSVAAVDLPAEERIAGQGDLFGEGVLFPEELGPLRLESARTLSFVSAFILTAASMREIEAEYPAVNRFRCSGPPALAYQHSQALVFCTLSRGFRAGGESAERQMI